MDHVLERQAQSRAASHNWQARMIRPLSDAGVGTPASFVHQTFSCEVVSGAETLRVSALGLYRAFINGKRVGEDLLTPGWTCYDARLSYQTYAVGDLLVAGENTIEIWLADGWYRSQIMWGDNAIFNCWGDQIAAIAELRASASPTDTLLVGTDGDWRSGTLPIRRSGIYLGEVYDARHEDTREITDGVATLDFDTTKLIAHETQPVRELEPLAVRNQWDDAGRTVYDFGQNSAGYVALSVVGQAGARVRVEHSEIIDKDGVFENSNLRTAACELDYTLKGAGVEHYRPMFTFQGFRYVRVTIEGDARLQDIRAIPISSVYPQIGRFSCGNDLVNRLVENTLWSQRANFIEVPTDCPQRDERLGWTGDAQVFSMTACYLHDSHDFLRKWVRDLMVDQREDGAVPHLSPDPTRLHPDAFPGFFGATGWGDAIEIVPWTLYLHYADRDILAEALPAMIAWVDFVWSISDGPIVSPPRQWGSRGFSFGDWLQPKGPSAKPLPTIGDEASATIYLHIASKLIGRIAALLGESETAERMNARAEAVRDAFIREFVTETGRIAYDDQTSYALAIVHDLIPEDKIEAARHYFRNAIARAEGRIQTGFIGTPALLPALIKLGEVELAQQVFLQEQVPGWLYQVKNGATTIWERWDAIQEDGSVFDPQMNSYNHYAYGAVCQWLFESVAGIRTDAQQPGFENVIFEPVILPALSPVSAQHAARTGEIGAAWSLEGDQVTYEVTVPQGARGTLRLAKDYREATLEGVAIESGRDHPLDPGTHTVRFTLGALRPGLPAFAQHSAPTP